MSQDKTYAPFQDLIAQLHQVCQERRTGTLFIATDDNRLARISVEQGQIVFLAFQTKRGAEALPLMRQINAGRSRFEDGMITAVSKIPLPSTDEMLAYLNGAAAPAEPVPVKPPPQTGMPSPLAEPISADAVAVLEAELAEHIGPLAGIICAEHRPKHYALGALAAALAEEIPDPDRAAQFLERVRLQLGIAE